MPRHPDEPRTREQALQRFPCPTCSRSLGHPFAILSPGLVDGMHVFGKGTQQSPCWTCQRALADRMGLSMEGYPYEIASKLIEQRWPVRYTVEAGKPGTPRSARIIDALTGEAVEEGLLGVMAERRVQELTERWFLGLPEVDPAVHTPTREDGSLAQSVLTPRVGVETDEGVDEEEMPSDEEMGIDEGLDELRQRVGQEGLGYAILRYYPVEDVEALVGERHPELLADWRVAREAMARIEQALGADRIV